MGSENNIKAYHGSAAFSTLLDLFCWEDLNGHIV